VISPLTPQDGLFRTWGAFTLYRNANATNQLFRLAPHPLKELLDTRMIFYLDEWGGTAQAKYMYRNSTMSGILTSQQLGIRVYHGGLPFVWDGICEKEKEHCAECTLDLSPNATHQLTTTRANCTAKAECQQEEVLLCHYQFSKRTLEASLKGDDEKTSRLINDGRLRASYSEGFTPSPFSS